jgi:hypothetical protein
MHSRLYSVNFVLIYFIMRYLCTNLLKLFLLVVVSRPVFAQQVKPVADTVTLKKGNSYFNLAFNAAGLSSLKKPGDRFPTDYISKGRAFGELTLKYKAGNESIRGLYLIRLRY